MGNLGGTGYLSCAAGFCLARHTDTLEGSGQRKRAVRRTPGCADSKRCLGSDNDMIPAKPPVFLKGPYFWVSERFLVQPWTEPAEGGRVIFFGCLRESGFWVRNLWLFQMVYSLWIKGSFCFPPNFASRVFVYWQWVVGPAGCFGNRRTDYDF